MSSDCGTTARMSLRTGSGARQETGRRKWATKKKETSVCVGEREREQTVWFHTVLVNGKI